MSLVTALHCKDCGRFIKPEDSEPLPLCTPCIDKRLLAFAPELELEPAARGTR